jgi:membrane protease YdiL (CAAX protease family)
MSFSATHLHSDHHGESERWRWFVLWMSGFLTLWMVAWIVHEAVFVPRGWCLGSWGAGLYWTVAKLAVWIGPTIWLLRRSHEPLGAATGLGTARGLPQGVLIAFAWLGIQALTSKVRGVWPPPQSTGGYGAVNAYIIAPVFEELVFRGFALRRLRARGVRFWPAALATSIAFGLLHVPGWLFMKGVSVTALSLLGPVVFVGVVLAAVSWRLPSLWACIAVHLANNAWHGGLVSALTRSLTANVARWVVWPP